MSVRLLLAVPPLAAVILCSTVGEKTAAAGCDRSKLSRAQSKGEAALRRYNATIRRANASHFGNYASASESLAATYDRLTKDFADAAIDFRDAQRLFNQVSGCYDASSFRQVRDLWRKTAAEATKNQRATWCVTLRLRNELGAGRHNKRVGKWKAIRGRVRNWTNHAAESSILTDMVEDGKQQVSRWDELRRRNCSSYAASFHENHRKDHEAVLRELVASVERETLYIQKLVRRGRAALERSGSADVVLEELASVANAVGQRKRIAWTKAAGRELERALADARLLHRQLATQQRAGAPTATRTPAPASGGDRCLTGTDGAFCMTEAQRLRKSSGYTSTTLAYYERACTLGAHKACGSAGWQHVEGKGTPRDFKKAMSYFTKQCDFGDDFGCGEAGFMYGHGRGVAKDRARAAALNKRSCRAGNAVHCFNVADFSSDRTEAVTHAKRSCDLGYQRGCKKLRELESTAQDDGSDAPNR